LAEDSHRPVVADSHKLAEGDNCMGCRTMAEDSSHVVEVDTWGLEVDSCRHMDGPVAVGRSLDHKVLFGYRNCHTARMARRSAALRHVSQSDLPAVYPRRPSPAASPSLFPRLSSFYGFSALLCRTCDNARSLSHCGIPAASRTTRMACTHRFHERKNLGTHKAQAAAQLAWHHLLCLSSHQPQPSQPLGS